MVEIHQPCKLREIEDHLRRGDRLVVRYQGRSRGENRDEIRVVRIDDKSGKGGQLNVVGCSPRQWAGRKPWVTIGSGTIVLDYKPKRRDS